MKIRYSTVAGSIWQTANKHKVKSAQYLEQSFYKHTYLGL